MGTQWRAGGFGVIGLDYPAVDWTARRLCPPVDVDWRMLRKLQALERIELARLHGAVREQGRSGERGVGHGR